MLIPKLSFKNDPDEPVGARRADNSFSTNVLSGLIPAPTVLYGTGIESLRVFYIHDLTCPNVGNVNNIVQRAMPNVAATSECPVRA